mgnify:CR=1 FL=1
MNSIIFSLASLLVCFEVHSQNVELQSEKPPLWMVFNKSNTSMPGNSVSSIAQDAAGMIWVGVSGKLMGFNGKEWKNFHKPGFWKSSSEITCIAVDEQQRKWVGNSTGGIGILEDEDWIVMNKKNSGLTDNHITSIAIDDKSRVWIGALSGGLIVYDDGKWKTYNTDSSEIPDNKVLALTIDAKQDVILQTKSGLAKFDRDSTWEVYQDEKYNMPMQYANSIATGPGGFTAIACGTSSSGEIGGLVYFKNGFSNIFTHLNSPLKNNNVSSVAIDRHGGLWVTCRNFSSDDFKNETESFIKGGILYNKVGGWNDLTPEFSRFLKSTPVNIVNYPGIETEKEAEINCHNVQVVFIDISGNKWFGTSNGLFVYNENGVVFK